MEEPVLETRHGVMRGKRYTTRDGYEYNSFSGIPYAKPPIGQLRFKDPEVAESWEGVLDATKEGNDAVQFNTLTRQIVGSEDCLYLNVYIPKAAREGHRLPVLVYIHGGGFINGSGSRKSFGPDYLIKENIIFVSINYRLGVMGFLCTDAINARGDMGLKDQNMALQWINRNIHYFGGDPDNVTLFGISAGAASVEYQILSKKSNGLFQRAIMHSGSTLNPWARTYGGLRYAERLARKLGFKESQCDGVKIFKYLNGFKAERLVQCALLLQDVEDLKEGKLFGCAPVLNELEDYEGFIVGEPIDLLRNGDFNQVSAISGICDKEGMGMLMYGLHAEVKRDFSEGKFGEYVPGYLRKNMGTIEHKIYAKRPDEDENDDDVIDFLTDVNFAGGVMYSLKQRLKHNPYDEYFYRFTYDGNLNMVKKLNRMEKKGACHGDDLTYLGANDFVDLNAATEDDVNVRKRMVKMWTNFVKVGLPTMTPVDGAEWLPMKAEHFRYMNIDKELKMFSGIFNPDRIKLWNDIYENVEDRIIIV